jgi:hypothetical protein
MLQFFSLFFGYGGLAEKRGRPRRLTPQNVKALERTRKRVIAAAKGEREVPWREIIKKARVPDVHASVAGRSLKAQGEKQIKRLRAKLTHGMST